MAMIKKMKQERLTAGLIQHGGVERLIVDAAIELASHGHNVHIFIAHDKNQCFEETWVGIFFVTVYGDFLPRYIFYYLHVVCAYLRCVIVAICMLFMWSSFDVILVDQVSVVILLLKLKKSTKLKKKVRDKEAGELVTCLWQHSCLLPWNQWLCWIA